MRYWLYRHDRKIEDTSLNIRHSPADVSDATLVWGPELGFHAYAAKGGRKLVGGVEILNIIRITRPIGTDHATATFPGLGGFLAELKTGDFQYLPEVLGKPLMEFVMAGGKIAPDAANDSVSPVTPGVSVLSGADVLGGRANTQTSDGGIDVDLRKTPALLSRLLAQLPVQPSPGARSVLMATAVLASEYQRVRGEYSTIQSLLGLVESAEGGHEYRLEKHEREALQALADVVTRQPGYGPARKHMTDHPHSPPLLRNASPRVKKVTSGAETIITKASHLAHTQGAAMFGADHLVRAFLASPGVSEQLPGWLDRIELTEELLAARWPVALEAVRNDRAGTYRALSDHVDGTADDLLDVNGDALTLARFIANRNTTPPMAIALFGEWGQGKSFFAKRVQSHVDNLSTQAKQHLKNRPGGGDFDDLPYHAHVCQVEFNAWHYMETNLWASLVDHIVTRLDEYMSGHPDQCEKLLLEVDQRAKELEDAEDQVKKANDASDEAANKVAEISKEVEAQGNQLKQLEYDWKTLWGKAHNALMTNGDLRKRIDNACGQLGLPPAGENAEALRHAYVLANEASTAWRPLGPFFKRYWWIAVFGALALWGLFQKIDIMAWLSPAGTGLTAAIAGLGVVSLWLGRIRAAGRLLSTAFAEVQSLARQGQSEAELELNKCKQLQQAALSRLTDARKRAAECRAALEEAQRKKAALAPQVQMREFFAQRMADHTYSKHLGLIATIRHDFGRLSHLLTDRSNASRSDLPDLRRIVLYVDDLDRCPPKVVLQVLQAIHLLLAFPLFMVVVAVDVRWLVRTLHKEHPFLAAALDPEQELNNHATAEDYLEKIFQIPYWVRPMDDLAAARYVDALMKATEPETKPSPADDADTDAEADAGKAQGNDEEQADEQGDTPRETPRAGSDLVPADLVPIRQDSRELHLARELAPHLGGSPRRSKRFVNLYLLAKLGMSNRQRSDLVTSNDYACIMVLLALLTAMPRSAGTVFDALRTAGTEAPLAPVDLPESAADPEERQRGLSILAIAERLEISRAKVRQWLPLARRHLFSVNRPPSPPATP